MGVFRILVVFMGIALGAFAPLKATGMLECACPHEGANAYNEAASHCCQSATPDPCCLEAHGALDFSADLMIEASGNSRVPQPEVTEWLSPLQSIELSFVQSIKAPRAQSPPGSSYVGPSLYQSWLI